MGANNSYTKTVNRVVQENIGTMTCTTTDEVDQSVSIQTGNLKLSGNCNFNVGNHATVESNCDMAGTFAALSSQEAIAEIQQTAAAGGAVNNASTSTENITRNINSIIQECQPGTVTQQKLTQIYQDIDCSDDVVFSADQTAKVEANCLLAAAARLDSQQKASSTLTQTVEGLLAGIFGPFIMIIGAVIGLIVLTKIKPKTTN